MAFVISISVCSILAQTSSQPTAPVPVQLTKDGEEWVAATLRSLSLEEKIGQMLMGRCFLDYATFDDQDYKALRDDLQKYHLGSLVVAAHVYRQGLLRASPLEAAKVANQLQADSKLPLLLAADLERGLASRLTNVSDFPWPMALGAAGDPANAERMGAITAREARAVGIEWALAPVADVNSNPTNPVINDRSFGEDPSSVGTLVSAFIRGAHQNGLLVTAKHFPGLGDSTTDPHHGITTINGAGAEAVSVSAFSEVEGGEWRVAKASALRPQAALVELAILFLQDASIIADALPRLVSDRRICFSITVVLSSKTGKQIPRRPRSVAAPRNDGRMASVCAAHTDIVHFSGPAPPKA